MVGKLKAIAKQDYGFDDFQWTKGKEYKVRVDAEFYETIILDNEGYEVYFCGEPKHLEDRFDFVEDEE